MENSVTTSFSSYIYFFSCPCVLAYSCKAFCTAPEPVVCVKSPVETAGLGFQPMQELNCVWMSSLWLRQGSRLHDVPKPSPVLVVLSLMEPLSGSTRTVSGCIILLVFNSVKARKAVLISSQSRTGPVEMLRNDKGQEVAECLWLFGLDFPGEMLLLHAWPNLCHDQEGPLIGSWCVDGIRVSGVHSNLSRGY